MSKIKQQQRAEPMLSNMREFNAALSEHRNHWKRAAYSTHPANGGETESYVEEFYRNELKCEPPKCVWVDGPVHAKRVLPRPRYVAPDVVKGIRYDSETAEIIDAKLRNADAQITMCIPAQRLIQDVSEALAQLRDPLMAGGNRPTPIGWQWHEYPDRGMHRNLMARHSLISS